jgi:hypothetical protein
MKFLVGPVSAPPLRVDFHGKACGYKSAPLNATRYKIIGITGAIHQDIIKFSTCRTGVKLYHETPLKLAKIMKDAMTGRGRHADQDFTRLRGRRGNPLQGNEETRKRGNGDGDEK